MFKRSRRSQQVVLRFKNDEAERRWQELFNNNINCGGIDSKAMLYAYAWAIAMQQGVDAGHALANIWRPTSEQAPYANNVPGYVFNYVAQMICEYWVYGEELRAILIAVGEFRQ